MTLTALAALATISLTPTQEIPAQKDLILSQAQPFISTQGAAVQNGNYMTTPQGCTYRKTQAPGYPARWILVLNPHHIGKPNSPRNCKGMM
jgi:hypothetical protein